MPCKSYVSERLACECPDTNEKVDLGRSGWQTVIQGLSHVSPSGVRSSIAENQLFQIAGNQHITNSFSTLCFSVLLVVMIVKKNMVENAI